MHSSALYTTAVVQIIRAAALLTVPDQALRPTPPAKPIYRLHYVDNDDEAILCCKYNSVGASIMDDAADMMTTMLMTTEEINPPRSKGILLCRQERLNSFELKHQTIFPDGSYLRPPSTWNSFHLFSFTLPSFKRSLFST